MLEKVWRKGKLLYCWWEYKLVQPLWRTDGGSSKNYRSFHMIRQSHSSWAYIQTKLQLKKIHAPLVHDTLHNTQDMDIT